MNSNLIRIIIMFFLFFNVCFRATGQKALNKFNISVDNPDTSLAIFLWNNDSIIRDFSNYREEYIRWNLEYIKIKHLIKCLYGNDTGFSRRYSIIENNKRNMVVYARKIVLEDYNIFHSVNDEMEFDFLVKKRDSLVIPLIKKAISDQKVDSKEKKELKKILSSQKNR